MTTPAKEHTRAGRLREHAAAVQQGAAAVAAMGLLVRGREARAWPAAEPPEVVFAGTEVEGRALPAAVWVALRRDDVDAAIDTMLAVSCTTFLVSAHEEMGAGYRLQTVEETRPLPEVALLQAQLSAMLGIPADVLGVIGDWGRDDPRSQAEVDVLLDRRFGPVRAGAPGAPGAPVATSDAVRDTRPAVVDPPPTPGIAMTVAEIADVLQLSEEQVRSLATLVRRIGVTVTA